MPTSEGIGRIHCEKSGLRVISPLWWRFNPPPQPNALSFKKTKKGKRETSPDAVGCKSHPPHLYKENTVGFIPAASEAVFCVFGSSMHEIFII
jgi:hypothetical protein